MRKVKLLAIGLLSLLAISACNNDDDPQPDPNNNNNNNNSNWNWTGTPPFSVKIDGVPFNTNPSSVMVTEFSGYYYISADNGSDKQIAVDIKTDDQEGQEYTLPSPDNVNYIITNDTGYITMQASSGKVKIITNNTTTLEGYFYSNMTGIAGSQGSATFTEGYFKVSKP